MCKKGRPLSRSKVERLDDVQIYTSSCIKCMLEHQNSSRTVRRCTCTSYACCISLCAKHMCLMRKSANHIEVTFAQQNTNPFMCMTHVRHRSCFLHPLTQLMRWTSLALPRPPTPRVPPCLCWPPSWPRTPR